MQSIPCVYLSQENAVEWLRQVKTNESFQASYKPWLRSLPKGGDLLCRELFTQELVEMLDSDILVRTCNPCLRFIWLAIA